MHSILYTKFCLIGSADLTVTDTVVFDPSTSQRGVTVEVPNNSVSERRKEFSILIARIEAINNTGALTAVEGQPVGITVYDNDCKYSYFIS